EIEDHVEVLPKECLPQGKRPSERCRIVERNNAADVGGMLDKRKECAPGQERYLPVGKAFPQSANEEGCKNYIPGGTESDNQCFHSPRESTILPRIGGGGGPEISFG